MKKNGMLILAQADHLTGEELGFAIDQIMSRGAENVYVLPGITKKNRSGCLLLLDIDPDKEADWAGFLAEEFSIFGYHVIQTCHYCSPQTMNVYEATIRKDNVSTVLDVRFKAKEGGGGYARAEHADVARAREQVRKELGINISLSKMRAYLETEAATNQNGSFTGHSPLFKIQL